MTTIHLVRHGEVDNPDGILYGRLPNFGLTERGHEMARRVGEHFAAAAVTPVELVASRCCGHSRQSTRCTSGCSCPSSPMTV